MRVGTIAIAFLLLIASPSLAHTINATGDTFSVNFGGNVGGVDVPGLTASADFTVASFTSTSVILDIKLSNTTDGSIWESSRVSAIGMNVSEPIASASTSGVFQYAILDSKFPNQYGSLDVCAIDNKNNCNGGGGGGLTMGQMGTVTLTLNFANSITSLDLSNIGVRWQSLASKQLGISGDSGTGGGGGDDTPGGAVPEPSAIIVFAAGMLLAGSRLRRRS